MELYALSCKTPQKEEDWQQINDKLGLCNPGSLVLLPEYFIDGPERYSGRELTDPEVDNVRALALTHMIYVASGMVGVNKEGNKYILGVLFDPDGDLVGYHTKTHPTSFEKKSGIFPGPVNPWTLKTDFGTVGFTLCKDIWYPDTRIAPEIILHPRGFGLDHPQFGWLQDRWLMLDRTTAMIRKAYFIGATGDYDQGTLCDIIDFEGTVLAQDTSTLVHATVDLERLRKYREGKLESKLVPRF